MTRWFAVSAVVALLGAGSAQAQSLEAGPGPGTVEVTIIPGGATFFTEASDTDGPSFGNYDLGGSVTFNFNRFVGVEGEVSGLLGVSQSLDFAAGTSSRGNDASSSVTVHGAFRSAVALRTRATSSAVANAAVFPKLFLTYETTSAIH